MNTVLLIRSLSATFKLKGIIGMASNNNTSLPRCSFCQREEHEVNFLIPSGTGLYICDFCVETCQEIIEFYKQEIKRLTKSKEVAEVMAADRMVEAAEIEAELAIINSLIEQLQAKDVDLENKITELKEYVNGELKSTEDWVEATFATLEQYNSLALEVATVKVDIETINASLDELEESFKKLDAHEMATPENYKKAPCSDTVRKRTPTAELEELLREFLA